MRCIGGVVLVRRVSLLRFGNGHYSVLSGKVTCELGGA